jgi:hypothetical protein
LLIPKSTGPQNSSIPKLFFTAHRSNLHPSWTERVISLSPPDDYYEIMPLTRAYPVLCGGCDVDLLGLSSESH